VAKHQRADETYQRILQSSAALFAERGFLGTTLTDLVERSGLTKSAFHAYFANKDAIAVAIVEYTGRQWPALISQFETMRAPAVDTVIALSFEVADRFTSDVVVRAGLRLSLERDAIKTPVPPPLHGWVDEIERLLSPAGEWELMGLAAPAEVAARVIVTCLIGAQYLAGDGSDDGNGDGNGGVDLARRLTELWTVILPGLRPTPDPAARIGTGQALREKARAAAAATAPTTMMRIVAPVG
jgi:AcrR family transcriptional regulator